MSTTVLFRISPYVAMAMLGAGLIVRYLLALGRMHVTAAALAEDWGTYGAGKLLKISLCLLALGHAVALIFPRAIFFWDSPQSRLYLLEGSGFLIGMTALLGWGRIVWRHLERRHPSRLCDVADSVFLSLVLVGLVTGVLTAAVYRWAGSWGTATLTPYARSLLTGKPTTVYVAQMPFVVQLHVFSSFCVLALFPFTRLGLLPVVAWHRLGERLSRVVGPLAKRTSKSLERWLRRHNPAAWIWADEIEDRETQDGKQRNEAG